MSWEVLPGRGFASVELSNDRSTVRASLGGEYRTFRRSGSDDESDQFLGQGIIVTYDHEDKASFIEVGAPCEPLLFGLLVLGSTLAAVRESAYERNLTISKLDEESFEITPWKVGLWVPDEEDGLIKGISVG